MSDENTADAKPQKSAFAVIWTRFEGHKKRFVIKFYGKDYQDIIRKAEPFLDKVRVEGFTAKYKADTGQFRLVAFPASSIEHVTINLEDVDPNTPHVIEAPRHWEF